jgi:hypothetical protein
VAALSFISSPLQDLSLKEAETLALSTLKQVMEEKVSGVRALQVAVAGSGTLSVPEHSGRMLLLLCSWRFL